MRWHRSHLPQHTTAAAPLPVPAGEPPKGRPHLTGYARAAQLLACLIICACGSDGPSYASQAPPTLDAAAAFQAPICGLGATHPEPCPSRRCIALPLSCDNDDNPRVPHGCRSPHDCEDTGPGDPYCIATNVGCQCLQRCHSDDQCEGGTCECEPGKYGVCRTGAAR